MKSQIFKPNFLLFVFLLFAFPIMLFAQDVPPGDLENTFATLAGLVAGVVLVTGLYKKYVNDKNTFVVSIVVSTLTCGIGWHFQFGVFTNLLWWHALLYDIGIVFIVKGTVSIELIITILELLKIGPKKPE